MVRNKHQPQQLNEQQQRRAQWNLLDRGENAENNQGPNEHEQRDQAQIQEPENDLALLINDELIEDDDNDVDFIPGAFGEQALRQREVHWGRLPAVQDEDEEGDSDVVEIVEEENDGDSDVIDIDDEDDEFYVPIPRRERQRRERRVNFEGFDDIPAPRRPQRVPRPRVVNIDYGEFAEVLNNCQLYCKVIINDIIKSCSAYGKLPEATFCHFGEISLQLKGHLSNVELQKMPCTEFWVYVSLETDKSAVYFEWSDTNSPIAKKKKQATNFKHFMVEGLLDLELWQGLSTQKYFKITVKSFEETTQEMTLDVHLKRSGLIDPERAIVGTHVTDLVGKVVSYFSGVPFKIYSGEKTLKHDVEDLYKAIKDIHNSKHYSELDVQHPSLIPKLRPYQKAAVRWMLHQEKYEYQQENGRKPGLHCLYAEVCSKDGVTFYFNKYAGYVVKEKPLAVLPSPGGILADEMGLGKTVEVLCCILMHSRKDVPKPVYQEPMNVQQRLHKKLKSKKNDHGEDIYTLDCKNSNEVGQSLQYDALDDSNGNVYKTDGKYEKNLGNGETSLTEILLEENADNEEKESLPAASSRRKRKSGGIKVHIPKRKNAPGKDTSDQERKSSRPKRQAAKQSCYEDFDYFDEEEVKKEELYEPSNKRASKEKTRYNAEDEIAGDDMWVSIESAIVEECWDGNYKQYKKEGSHKEFRKFLKLRKKDPYYMMSMKQRLDIQYSNTIAAYSAVSAVSRRAISGFFDTKVAQKSFFECICGSSEAENYDDKFRVQCSKCSLWQHAECVQFDINDPYRGEYICPHCWTQETPVLSGATLIVTPSSIGYQWKDEILKHLKDKAMRMLVYKGVGIQGYMQPRYLGSFDIVITTYETLRRELNYVDLPHSNSQAGRRFRFPKRFMATPSPLPSVEWWRVCLDEAQMVECTTTKTAEMALRLAATNRWCVTGTPIQKSIDDLQGLLMFLGVDPYWVPQWWQRCLYNPYCYGNKEPLNSLVAQYMWRNAKKDVVHQIDIPQQTEEVHWLNFTRVEEHFYKRLHTECSYDAQQKLKKIPDRQIKLSSLDRKTLSNLLQPLLKLRQACNHPQVVKGQFLSMNKKTMTMEMLLENLVKKTKLEAEDEHRVLVSSLNGLAAIHIIKEEWKEAVDVYREVLMSVEKHSSIKTDSLQRLHSIHNLAEILGSNHEGIHPTLRDDGLREEAAALKKRYLQQYPEKVVEANIECSSNTESVKTLKEDYNSKRNWWLGALESFDEEFVREIREELLSPYSRFEEPKCIFHPVRSKAHLLKVVNMEINKMKQLRDDMIEGVLNLHSLDPASLLDGAIDCHLRPSVNDPPKCLLCDTSKYFEVYEETLFSMKDRKHNRTTEVSKETYDIKDKANVVLFTRKGNWGKSEIERCLKYLQIKCLGKVDEEIYEDSQTHMQILEAMKKEFKNYRILWRAIYDSVAAMDEVNMATLRLRLRFPDEEVPQQKKKDKKNNEAELEKELEAVKYIIEPSELPQQELKLKCDKVVSENNLKAKLGQLLYLQNLSKTDFGKEEGKNPEPCPICQIDLGEKWTVLLCGHSYCMECIRNLSNRGFNGLDRSSIKCPICRQPTLTKEICYVDMKAKQEEEVYKVQGSLSTKMEGVVRLILKIKQLDPEAKVLVFSAWNDVLDVIGDAFAQNGITYRALHQHYKFHRHLSSFKSSSQITALLLPITSGANGLNIIEARHVILVEPILNPAAELQAVGRVHRIGQSKETFVHKFIVKGTIEERMYKVIRGHHEQVNTDENTVTIEDLRKLFLHPEELELQEQIAQAKHEHTRVNSESVQQISDENSIAQIGSDAKALEVERVVSFESSTCETSNSSLIKPSTSKDGNYTLEEVSMPSTSDSLVNVFSTSRFSKSNHVSDFSESLKSDDESSVMENDIDSPDQQNCVTDEIYLGFPVTNNLNRTSNCNNHSSDSNGLVPSEPETGMLFESSDKLQDTKGYDSPDS